MQAAVIGGYRRQPLLWAAGGFAAIFVVAVSGLVLFSRPGPADRRTVDARCAIVAGQHLTSSAVRIRCGLEKGDIERVTAQALSGIDLGGLVEKARKGQLEDQAAVGALVERLGIDAPQIIQTLQQLGR